MRPDRSGHRSMVLLEMIRIGKRLCGGAVARPRQACGRRAALSVCGQFAQLIGFLVPLVRFAAFKHGLPCASGLAFAQAPMPPTIMPQPRLAKMIQNRGMSGMVKRGSCGSNGLRARETVCRLATDKGTRTTAMASKIKFLIKRVKAVSLTV